MRRNRPTTPCGPSLARAYDDHVWHVYGFFAYRTGSRDDAEDLTQATFERAVRAWSRFDDRRGTVRTWLMSIAHNLLIDHYRAGGTTRVEPLESGALGDAEPRVAGPETSLGLSPELAAALAELGDRDREIIALRFGGDLSGREIAELLDLSLANVQQVLSRSLRRLRAHLEEGEPTARRA
jgi:RNA polymerase sigma-70 factor (ECF subfamily)